MAEIGTVLGDRYRLVELLGQGGMARIYRAHDNQLDRAVAVKVLRPEYGRDPDFGSRFRHEAQAAASLNHPNIVSVYDYGTDAETGGHQQTALSHHHSDDGERFGAKGQAYGDLAHALRDGVRE